MTIRRQLSRTLPGRSGPSKKTEEHPEEIIEINRNGLRGEEAIVCEPCEEEEELLDLVTGLTQTSRLGCQLTMIEALNGLTLQLPHRKSNLIFED